MAISVPELSIFAIIIGTELLTGSILAFRRIKAKSQNLEFLVGFSFCAALTTIFYAFPDNLIRSIAFAVSLFLSGYFILVFTNRSFFEGKKSPFLKFFLINITTLFIYTILKIIIPLPGVWQMTAFYNLLISIMISIPGYWFGFLVIKQYRNIKNEDFEPWIKMRFLIAGIGAILEGSIGWISYMIVISQIPGVDPTGYLELLALFIYALILITYSIGFFIAFVMPERMKQYFNRNYTPSDHKELSEDEIMKQMGGE